MSIINKLGDDKGVPLKLFKIQSMCNMMVFLLLKIYLYISSNSSIASSFAFGTFFPKYCLESDSSPCSSRSIRSDTQSLHTTDSHSCNTCVNAGRFLHF